MTTLIKSIIEAEKISTLSPDFSLLKIIPKEVAQESQLIIFSSPTKFQLQALTTNNHPEQLHALLSQLQNKGYKVELFYTSNEGFQKAFSRYNQLEKLQISQQEKFEEDQKAEWKSAISLMKEIFESRESQDPGEFIKEIIRLGFQAGASDLHFQAEEEGIALKLRLDGILVQISFFSHQEFWKYMQKIKFISGVKMNIDYLPQDGRFSFQASNRNGLQKNIDARVSFMPGIKTENIVIRFLDASENIETFEEIGFGQHHIELLKQNMQKTTGIIIITGPTGSGKTTTLYTMLKKLNSWEKKIITLEDPIEYKISGIQQSQINYEKGYDYETGLKAILRQDPDIILVGETRTKETANIAINASLTGHLVFTTLHTNSVFDALTRLINMGIEPYLLTPALQLIIGQRLARKTCPHCQYKAPATPEQDLEIRKHLEKIHQKNPKILTPNGDQRAEYDGNLVQNHGCDACNHTGYQGRIALVEILEITESIREAILQGKYSHEILTLAEQANFLSLKEDGILKVIQWKTRLEEILRVSY